MKLFNLYVHYHLEDGKTPVLDAYTQSPDFTGKKREVVSVLPVILFSGHTKPPKYAFCHFFVLTTVKGDRNYGCCILFEDNKKNNELSAIALTSALPFYQTLKNVLTVLLDLCSNDQIISEYVINQIPMPPPGVTAVQFTLNDITFCVSRPPPNQLPLVDLPFWLPFALFKPEDLILIFTAILTEQRIVFSSKFPAAIAPFIESILTLIFPLTCYSTYIPNLASNMAPLLCSPLPYLIGVDPTVVPLDELEDDVLHVNLDDSSIFASEDSTPPSIPSKPREKLINALQKMTKLFNKDDKNWVLKCPSYVKKPVNMSHDQFHFTVPPSEIILPLMNGLFPEMINNGKPDLFEKFKKVRDAFLRFIIVLLMNTKEISGDKANTEKLKSKFYTQFIDTQCFHCFIDQISDFKKNERKVTTLKDANALFFLESLQAKINRSKKVHKKKPTPFLTSSHWRISSVFQVPLIPVKNFTDSIKPFKVAELVNNEKTLSLSRMFTYPLRLVKSTVISSQISFQMPYPEEKKKKLKKIQKMGSKNDVIKIEKYIRGYIFRKLFLQMKKSATMMNSFVRMAIAKQFYNKKMKPAAIKMHSTARMFILKKKYQKMRKAAILFESAYRCYKMRQIYLKMRKAAIRFEATFRMFILRKQFLKMKKAAILIEATFRMSQKRKEYVKMRKSAIKIESTFRMFILKKKYKQMKEAATLIESTFRMFLAKRKFKKEKECSIIIQKHVRGFLKRKQYKLILEEKKRKEEEERQKKLKEEEKKKKKEEKRKKKEKKEEKRRKEEEKKKKQEEKEKKKQEKEKEKEKKRREKEKQEQKQKELREREIELQKQAQKKKDEETESASSSDHEESSTKSKSSSSKKKNDSKEDQNAEQSNVKPDEEQQHHQIQQDLQQQHKIVLDDCALFVLQNSGIDIPIIEEENNKKKKKDKKKKTKKNDDKKKKKDGKIDEKKRKREEEKMLKAEKKRIYSAMSNLQKRRLSKKMFNGIFEQFDIPVKAKKRKDKLTNILYDILVLNPSGHAWEKTLLAAKLVLVGEKKIGVDQIDQYLNH